MENHLINPYKGTKCYVRSGEPPTMKKTMKWEMRTSRIRIFLEARGHKYIRYDQNMFYFEELPPMSIRQLRLYYDRQVYKEKKSKIENWSQSFKKRTLN